MIELENGEEIWKVKRTLRHISTTSDVTISHRTNDLASSNLITMPRSKFLTLLSYRSNVVFYFRSHILFYYLQERHGNVRRIHDIGSSDYESND